MGRHSGKRSLVVVALCMALVAVFVWVARPNLFERVSTGKGLSPVEHAQASLGHGTLETSAKTEVLKSTLAGTWYKADPDALRADLASYFEKAAVEPKEDVIALVLTHAGYQYSGPTAACGVKSLGRTYQRVVVIGPTHRLPMEDMFSVPRATHYETPLGRVPLDVEFADKLLKYPLFQDVPAAYQEEHSVQIEVPLLQYKLRDFKLVLVVAGQCSYDTVAKAGRILASLIDTDTFKSKATSRSC